MDIRSAICAALQITEAMHKQGKQTLITFEDSHIFTGPTSYAETRHTPCVTSNSNWRGLTMAGRYGSASRDPSGPFR